MSIVQITHTWDDAGNKACIELPDTQVNNSVCCELGLEGACPTYSYDEDSGECTVEPYVMDPAQESF